MVLSGTPCFYLVGGLEPWNFMTFQYWEEHHPNWRTPSFFRGVGQPPTSFYKFPWWKLTFGGIELIGTHVQTQAYCLPIAQFITLSPSLCLFPLGLAGSSPDVFWKQHFRKAKKIVGFVDWSKFEAYHGNYIYIFHRDIHCYSYTSNLFLSFISNTWFAIDKKTSQWDPWPMGVLKKRMWDGIVAISTH
jgi:hypothetical protein